MDRCYIDKQRYKSSTKSTASEFLTDTVNRCLTDDCKDCTGSYNNDIVHHRFICLCLCHRKCKKNAPLNQEEATEIYDNPDFWTIDKIELHLSKFHNIATTFGRTHFGDSEDKEFYLHCLDIDSKEVLKRVQALLEEEWKIETFVTKTQKDCGYHVYWFEHVQLLVKKKYKHSKL
jgi:hypothetical protein